MKIQYVSDLHLEGANLELVNTDKADLLVLAGDITTAKSYKTHEDFFKRCSDNWEDVVYVAGNHEFYRGDIEETREELFAFLYQRFKNIHFLENDTIRRKEFTIFGATLWTDFNGQNPLSKVIVQNGMNDYRIIQWKSRRHWKLRADDTLELHQIACNSLSKVLDDSGGKLVIVVTHHGPSYKSVHPRFEGDFHMNGGYVSDLEWMMEGNNIPLWFHGHVHNTFDYTVGKTRVLTNPRGYMILGRDGKRYTENEKFDPDKTIEI